MKIKNEPTLLYLIFNSPFSIFNYKNYGSKKKNKGKRSVQHGLYDRRHIPLADLLHGYLYRSNPERHQGYLAASAKANSGETSYEGNDRRELELLRGIWKAKEVQVSFDEITPFLQDSYAKEPEMFVALYADETVPYKEIVKILNIANENKFKMVLATRPQK